MFSNEKKILRLKRYIRDLNSEIDRVFVPGETYHHDLEHERDRVQLQLERELEISFEHKYQ